MTRVAVLQSNYLPWKGYFDIIHSVDVFVFYDDVQYTKNDWRNRNRIKTPNGTCWLTIPTGGDLKRLICDVEIQDSRWQKKHWKSLQQYYRKTPFFDQLSNFFEEFYLGKTWPKLSDLNQFLIRRISTEFLGLPIEFRNSRDYDLAGSKGNRLLDLLRQIGTDLYVSGPSAKNYLNEDNFRRSNIDVSYMDYSGYPEYAQQFPPFEHAVSVLDLLFNVGGGRAGDYIWGWRGQG